MSLSPILRKSFIPIPTIDQYIKSKLRSFVRDNRHIPSMIISFEHFQKIGDACLNVFIAFSVRKAVNGILFLHRLHDTRRLGIEIAVIALSKPSI